jgi:heme-degrading monooxygenase HmoA
MICRVALHEKTPGSVASDEARGFREWIKGLAGFVDGYHVQDSKTGRMLSITIWDSEESMEALRDLTPQGGSLGIRTDREELFDVVEKY